MNFSDVYAGIAAQIATVLSTHKRLADPYDLSANGGPFLAKGWGLAVSPGGVNTRRFLSSQGSLSVGLVLSVTRQVIATDSDASGKAAIDVALLGDFELLADSMRTANLGAPAGAQVDFVTFDGLIDIESGAGRFRALSCNVTAEYFRS